MGKDRGLFTSNAPYILWFMFYAVVFCIIASYLLGNTAVGCVIVIITYMISIPLALSPAGETLFKYMEGVRPLATNKEKEYLIPIFEEVYESVKLKNPNFKNEVQIHISDNLSPNAYAIGNTTIAVTKGLTEMMTEEQVKAFIGHEFGHIAHGDTKALILTYVGNIIFSVSVLALRLFIKAMLTFAHVIQINAFMTIIFSLVEIMLYGVQLGVELGVFAIRQLGDIILMATSRKNEFLADEFSLKIGYGEELISGLYELQNISTGGKRGILERLKTTHPYMADRIGKLEEMI